MRGDDDWARVPDALVKALTSEAAEAQVNPEASEAQAAERKQRLQEIRQEATKLGPKPEELRLQVASLRARIKDEGERRPDSRELAELHVELADVLKRLGQQRDALPELTAAANILAQHPEFERRLARIRSNLGKLLWRLGEKQQARTQLENARDLYIEQEGAESISTLLARLSLVNLYEEMGDQAAADQEEHALKIGATKKVVRIATYLFAVPVLGRFIMGLLQRDKKPKDNHG